MLNMANTTNNWLGGSINYAEKKRDANAPKPVALKAEGMKCVRMANTHYLMKTFMVERADQGQAVVASIKANTDSCLLLSDCGTIWKSSSRTNPS